VSGVSDVLVTKAVMALLDSVMPSSVVVALTMLPTAEELSLQPNSGDRLDPSSGFLVVNPVPPQLYVSEGFTDQPDSMGILRYQLTAGGLKTDQVEAIAGLATAAICDRADTAPHDYVNSLTVAGHHVMRRTKAGAGPVAPEAGLLNVVRFVDLMVCVTA
jgi:hypothetical protein